MGFYIFLVLSGLAVFFGLMTVLSRHPVYSVLYLIGCFFALAGHYLLLNAQFLAVVHLIVYAGAIMVLFLFTLMLMNLNEESEKHKPVIARLAAVISAGLMGLVMIAVLRKAELSAPFGEGNPAVGTVQVLGKVLLNEYLIPFEFVSILLLAAMVGAVLLAKKDKTVAVK